MAHRRPKRTTKALDGGGLLSKSTPVSLVLPSQMSFKAWEEAGAVLGQIGRSVSWWLVDWLNYGEDHYGEKFAQALDATGHDPKTLMNYARVGRAIPPSRRREMLSFAHHEVVSALEPVDQRHWLARAEKGDDGESWSSRRLRQELRKAETPDGPEPTVEVENMPELLTAILAEKAPLELVTLDVKAVRDLWNKTKQDVPGLRITPPEAPVLAELAE